LVVIEQAELELGDGLTVITGETGAGKTVLTNALALLAGGPADAGMVRPGHQQALVQATLSVPEGFWTDLDEDDPAIALRELVDDASEFTVTRRIPAEGRARSLVDGSVAPRAAVAALVGHLVRFSGQGDQRVLASSRVQLAALDHFCGPRVVALAAELAQVRREVRRLDRSQLRAREDLEARLRRRADLEDLIANVDTLAPIAGEATQLVGERDRLRYADRLARAAATAAEAIAPTQSDVGARELVGQAERAVGDVVEIDGSLGAALDLLREAQAVIGEAAITLRGYLDGLEAEPGRLDAVEGRLEQYARLAQRYGCDADALEGRAERARADVVELERAGNDDARSVAQREGAVARARGLAEQLAVARAEGAPALCAALRASLAELAMPEAGVRLELSDAVDPLEAQRATMYLQPNPGLPEAPLADVASGGELSRVLLALHGVSAATDQATWIFDEIDAGIGGVTASAVAARLAALGRVRQTVAITHLAQVAAAGDRQLVLAKDVTGGGIARTEITEVADEARIQELCRMLGAAPDDRAAREHVDQLIRSARADAAARTPVGEG
jgi:DNA repair protein RecN (Recombination protein N)